MVFEPSASKRRCKGASIFTRVQEGHPNYFCTRLSNVSVLEAEALPFPSEEGLQRFSSALVAVPVSSSVRSPLA